MTEFVDEIADDIAQGWLQTILAVAAQPGQKAFHTVTRIRSVADDGEPRIHRAATDLLDELDLQPLSTVANTIFPAAMAAQTPDIEALGVRYAKVYPQLKQVDTKNLYGTYFLRLVAYPGSNGPENQLRRVIANMRGELASRSPKRARYETSFECPSQDGVATDPAAHNGHELGVDDHTAAPVFVPGRDNRSMGFPCLSFLSFQHDRTRLHAVAHYRSQHLMERGLGNYLGIARLMRYLAEQTELQPGGLTIVAGQAYTDHLKKFQIADLEQLHQDLTDAGSTSETTAQQAGVR